MLAELGQIGLWMASGQLGADQLDEKTLAAYLTAVMRLADARA